MVVTSFTTHVTPLLRYAIGDVADPLASRGANARVVCRSLPYRPLLGASMISFTRRDRGYVGRLDTVFKKLPNSLVEAQIIQIFLAADHSQVVPDEKDINHAHAAPVVSEMRKRLGQVVEIELKRLDHIPRSANGKMRLVINTCGDRLPQSLRYSRNW